MQFRTQTLKGILTSPFRVWAIWRSHLNRWDQTINSADVVRLILDPPGNLAT